ncbi:MAG TPA: glycosyltransferase family 2 protein [Thermodesulfobacteriota bacterium]|nr:glycosyltransferase family 2 protein [Thermodesulfobacteriota bacterium]
MYRDKVVAVIVPAYNEEKLIGKVLQTVPNFVDRIVVVDDASSDRTGEVVKTHQEKDSRIVYFRHLKNEGVGGAIATGYKWARDNEISVSVVMAGDAQMDPEDLPKLLNPVIAGEVDYSKGNRLFTGKAWSVIPKTRYLGNAVLSFLTKIASGYWHVADSQTGYGAVNLEVLKTIDLDSIYKRYGMPNDFLVRLNVYHFRVRDIPVNPIYGIGERSGMRIYRVVFTLSLLLLKLFLWRLKEKYVIRDFHPLVLFYLLGFILTPIGVIFGCYLLIFRLFVGPVAATSALFAAFFAISGLQSLFFAMWFDMEYNKELK